MNTNKLSQNDELSSDDEEYVMDDSGQISSSESVDEDELIQDDNLKAGTQNKNLVPCTGIFKEKVVDDLNQGMSGLNIG